jgi:cytochrome c556
VRRPPLRLALLCRPDTIENLSNLVAEAAGLPEASDGEDDMRKWIAAGAVLAVIGAVGQAPAQDPLAQRIALMKDMGAQARTLTQMSRGQAPYDAAAATAAFTKIRDNAKTIPGLFPTPPKAGEKSRAAPAIWTDMARFKAAAAKLEADAGAAIPAAGGGQAALGPLLQKVGGDCNSCHEVFQLKE